MACRAARSCPDAVSHRSIPSEQEIGFGSFRHALIGHSYSCRLRRPSNVSASQSWLSGSLLSKVDRPRQLMVTPRFTATLHSPQCSSCVGRCQTHAAIAQDRLGSVASPFAEGDQTRRPSPWPSPRQVRGEGVSLRVEVREGQSFRPSRRSSERLPITSRLPPARTGEGIPPAAPGRRQMATDVSCHSVIVPRRWHHWPGLRPWRRTCSRQAMTMPLAMTMAMPIQVTGAGKSPNSRKPRTVAETISR